MNAPIDWKAEAKKIAFRDKAFIGGAFVPALERQDLRLHLAGGRTAARPRRIVRA